MKRIAITITVVAMLAMPAALSAQGGPKNLQINPRDAEVRFGGTTTLSGKLTGQNNSGQTVTVERDPFPFGTFEPAGTATTNSSGDWSFAVTPPMNTRYRARTTGAESRTVDVNVRPAISFRLSDRTPAVRQRVVFSGRLCPEHDGTAVALQQRQPNGQWRSIRTLVLKDIVGETCSSYSRTLRPRRTRAYRVHFNGDGDHVAGNSAVRVARVH